MNGFVPVVKKGIYNNYTFVFPTEPPHAGKSRNMYPQRVARNATILSAADVRRLFEEGYYLDLALCARTRNR